MNRKDAKIRAERMWDRIGRWMLGRRPGEAVTDVVAGNRLPGPLSERLRANRWYIPEDGQRLFVDLIGIPERCDMVSFLGLRHIEDAQRASYDEARDYPEDSWTIYGIGSSTALERPIDLPYVDIDKAVPIITSLTEMMVLLDYREDPGNPRVVAPVPSDWSKWRTIAPDFEAFCRALGLD